MPCRELPPRKISRDWRPAVEAPEARAAMHHSAAMFALRFLRCELAACAAARTLRQRRWARTRQTALTIQREAPTATSCVRSPASLNGRTPHHARLAVNRGVRFGSNLRSERRELNVSWAPYSTYGFQARPLATVFRNAPGASNGSPCRQGGGHRYAISSRTDQRPFLSRIQSRRGR